MPQFRAFPLWQVAPRSVEVEAVPGEPIRAALARFLGIRGEVLKGLDRQGSEAPLDAFAPDSDRLGDLAVSTRSILRPEGIFEGDGLAWTEDPGEPEAIVPSALEQTAGRLPLRESERLLAFGLHDLGFGIDADLLAFEAKTAAFPELPPGWGVHHSSPYRIVLSCGVTLGESGLDRLEWLEEQVERVAPILWQKLKLTDPDALDLRLHVFYENRPEERALLRARFATPASAQLPGQIRRGWRRVVLHPFREEGDRLLQSANLARRVLAERLDRALRRRIQGSCGAFVSRYAREEGRIFDFQVHAYVRTGEERLAGFAEEMLLDRLGCVLADTDRVSSGRSEELAANLLRSSGFFPRHTVEEGERLLDVAWRLAGPDFEEQDTAFGGAVENLGPATDGALLDWLQGLSRPGSLELLGGAEVEEICRTVVADAAARLRQEIEGLLERRVLPAEGALEIPFAQFFDAVETLASHLETLRAPGSATSDVTLWLAERRDALQVELPGLVRSLIATADPLSNVLKRALGRLGVGRGEVYLKISQELAQLRRCWLELRLIEFLLQGGAGPLADLVEDLAARLSSFARETASHQAELCREMERRERIASLGAITADRPVSDTVLERLRLQIEALPVEEALRRVFRRDGRLRNVFRLEAGRILEDLLSELSEPLRRIVSGIASEDRFPALEPLLASAVETLFSASVLPHHGSEGRVGALDGHTHLHVVTTPELAAQLGGPESLVHRLRGALTAASLPDHLPIDVFVSRSAPGLLLSRCVHALDLDDFGL